MFALTPKLFIGKARCGELVEGVPSTLDGAEIIRSNLLVFSVGRAA